MSCKLNSQEMKERVYSSIKEFNYFCRNDKNVYPPLLSALNEMFEDGLIKVSIIGEKQDHFEYVATDKLQEQFHVDNIKMDIIRYLRFNRYYRTKPNNTYGPFLNAVKQLFEEGMLVENGVSEYYHATTAVPKTVLVKTLETSKIQVGDIIADYVWFTKRMDHVTKQYFELQEEHFNKLGVVIDISHKRKERTLKEKLFNYPEHPEKLYHTFELDGQIKDICLGELPNKSLTEFPKFFKQKL